MTVNNGTGGGEYAEDDDVVITANNPETGKQFKEWTGVEGLAFTSGSATTATTTFTMPKHAVEVTATYEDIAAVTTHTLTISYVKPDGTPAPETHTAALTKGTRYSVASPVVEGYTSDKATVSGIMGTEDISITVTYTIIGTEPIKTDPAVTAPEAKADLVYNESSQELLTAGSVDGGTMWYTLGSDATTAPADSLYTTSVPAAIEAGTYYVWYKVVGDENHNDSDPKCVSVTISATGSPDNQNPNNQNPDNQNSGKKDPDNQDPGKKDPNNGGNNQGGGNRKDKKTEKITISKRPSYKGESKEKQSHGFLEEDQEKQSRKEASEADSFNPDTVFY